MAQCVGPIRPIKSTAVRTLPCSSSRLAPVQDASLDMAISRLIPARCFTECDQMGAASFYNNIYIGPFHWKTHQGWLATDLRQLVVQ